MPAEEWRLDAKPFPCSSLRDDAFMARQSRWCAARLLRDLRKRGLRTFTLPSLRKIPGVWETVISDRIVVLAQYRIVNDDYLMTAIVGAE